ASTDNIEIMHEILDAKAANLGIKVDDLKPEQWLQDFYDNRKGSGKRQATNSEARPARSASM
ncbi:hypothetical protein, partial [Dyella sp.]|uniref:hypothetical protein n=1 Tax=Dyella sp. TaxID=1869338 RepID=UPI002ED44900